MTAKDIAKNSDSRIRRQTEVLASQVLAIAEKLAEAEKQLASEELVIPYDNGGGQSGMRENPFYQAYEKLLASYAKALTTLLAIIGEEEAENLTSLDAFRSKVKIAK